VKRLLLMLFLLSGCVKFNGPVPWKQPDKSTIVCTGDTCCYPSSPRTMECLSSQPFNGTVIIYIKVIEK